VKWAPGYCCALLVALGCGGPNDPFGDPFNNPVISSQRLSGTISGQPWSFRTGDAAQVRGIGASQYVVNLYGDTREACTAFGVAQQNRLDLMNARASVVDAWRLIQVRADALKAGLDVVFDGQLDTLGDNPFRFRSPTGQLRAGLRWDTPITRLTERNVYRQELIFFQRARVSSSIKLTGRKPA